MDNTPNARLWVHTGKGPVKLTLKPNQKLNFSSGEEIDEGYLHYDTELEYQADGRILMEIKRRLCNDEGLFSSWDDYVADLRDLAKIPYILDTGIQFPSWQWHTGARP